MKILNIAVLLVIASVGSILSAEIETSDTLEQARELGRTKSRFLAQDAADTSVPTTLPKANVDYFAKSVEPILKEHCLVCHGPETSEGRLRVDQLDPDLLSGVDVERWREIYNVLSNSEMPPEGESDLADEARGNIVNWLSDELNKASLVRRNSKDHSSFRRLTKYEYNYALQDLLGVSLALADKLPPETVSEDGFKNSSELLQMSASQFEAYREIGLKALQRATVSGERPTPITYIVSMQEEMAKATSGKNPKTFDINGEIYRAHRNRQHLYDRNTGKGIAFSKPGPVPHHEKVDTKTAEVSPVVLVLPKSNELKLNLDRFLPDEGIMRVRIRAGRSNMNSNEYASLRLAFSAHTSNNANFSQVISQRDVPVTSSADEPQFLEFDISLGDIQRNPFRKLDTPFPRRDEFLHIKNVSNAHDPDQPLQVMIDRIEIIAPFYEQWPPKTHTDIFIESENRSDEEIYSREVLTRFLRRVWRRPASKQEVDQFAALFAKYRPGFSTFEETMVEVLATALATPEFLYLMQRTQRTPKTQQTQRAQRAADGDSDSPSQISDLEFASRLSFFLWCSMPDEELLSLAEKGKLRDEAILKAQVERMLEDPRSERFSQHFVQQWLGLDGLDSVTHVEDDLRESMREEPIAFFNEVLTHNLSAMDFLHSDYALINEQLAAHYKIPDVYGPHFRKVPISPQTNRGGILTGAAIMAMNSDGKDSHPLKRGVWMLERVLHDPPPPPPPNVPEVDLTDPEILKMTLKERIANHRNNAACVSCHSRIDPWGIAFENYDALGVYRTKISGKPVDATSELFNKQTIAGMDGLKQYLLSERQDQFSRAMVHKLTAYALGRPLSFSDRADIDNLTVKFRKQGDGLRDLVHLIVRSDIFNAK